MWISQDPNIDLPLTTLLHGCKNAALFTIRAVSRPLLLLSGFQHLLKLVLFLSFLHFQVYSQLSPYFLRNAWSNFKLYCSLLSPSRLLQLPKSMHPVQLLCLVISFSVQLLSRVRPFVTPWTAALQASLYINNSWSLLKLMSIELLMPSNISSSVVGFSSQLQSFPPSGSFPVSWLFASSRRSIWNFSIRPSSEYSGLILLFTNSNNQTKSSRKNTFESLKGILSW